jgi:hypothetical protein
MRYVSAKITTQPLNIYEFCINKTEKITNIFHPMHRLGDTQFLPFQF